MKAQLVFEFMVAVVIFFGIIFYIINYLNTTVSGYSGDFYSENMESKASQIGELLVLNRGKWSGQTPDVVGLAEDWPVLNSTKIAWLDGYCNNNYPGLADKLGISYKNKLKIIINETESDGTVSNLVDCPYGKKVPGVARAEAKRYAVLNNGDIVTVYVYIW